MSNKVGRNSPCLCGSGRKNKHCCAGRLEAVLGSPLPASMPKLANPKQRSKNMDWDSKTMADLNRLITPVFDPEDLVMHCDHEYLYFEHFDGFGFRISSRGELSSFGRSVVSAVEFIYFLTFQEKHLDSAVSWKRHGDALKIFRGLPVGGNAPVTLKEVVLVTNYETALLPPVKAHSLKIKSKYEIDDLLFKPDRITGNAVGSFLDNQSDPAFWSIQYLMSDGTVLNPCSALFDIRGLALPKEVLRVKHTFSDDDFKCYWLYSAKKVDRPFSYFREVVFNLEALNVPIRLTNQINWQKRDSHEIKKITKFSLSNYEITIREAQLKASIPGPKWMGINMEWLFDRSTGTLAYHPGHCMNEMMERHFEDSFEKVNPQAPETKDYWDSYDRYRLNWHVSKEQKPAADGSLLFSLKNPTVNLTRAISQINGQLLDKGHKQGIDFGEDAVLDLKDLRTEVDLKGPEFNSLTWTCRLSHSGNPIKLPPLALQVILALQNGLGHFAENIWDEPSSSGKNRANDLKLLRHRGIARCFLAEVATVYTSDKKPTQEQIPQLCKDIEDKVSKVLAMVCGEPEKTMKDLCSAKSRKFFNDATRSLIASAIVPKQSLINVCDEIRVIDGPRLVMPFVATLINGLLSQYGEGAFLKNSPKSLKISESLDGLEIACELGKPIPFEVFFSTGIAFTLDGKKVEEIAAEDLVASFSLDDKHEKIQWFDLHPKVFFKGKEIPKDKLHEFTVEGIISYEGSYYLLDRSKVPNARWLAYFWENLRSKKRHAYRQNDFMEITEQPPNEVLGMLALRHAGLPVIGGERWKKIVASFDALCQRSQANQLPHDFAKITNISLRSFQEYGVQWLMDLFDIGLGGILADDMGLGKTVQAIAFLKALHIKGELGQSIIIMPPSLLHNWQSELRRFAPELQVLTIDSGADIARLANSKADVVMTTYGLLYEHQKLINQLTWNVAVFDEAQYLKNIKSRRTQAARQLASRMKVCLTGTPLENHYGEFFSLVDLVVPGALGAYSDFSKSYVPGASSIRQVSPEDVDFLRLKTLPLVMRRKKSSILKELPEKTETIQTLTFDREQKKIYRDTAISWNEKISALVDGKGENQAQLQMLTALLRLRQICSCPDSIESVAYKGTPPKFEQLKESLLELSARQEPVIVFTSFRTTLEKLEKELKAQGTFTLTMSGKTPTKQRAKILDQFERAQGHVVLLMTQKVGGVGLNLTKASYVFHIEPWWNPQVENQATDRVHRIGQERPVQVYRYIMEHSVEEKIQRLKASKFKLFSDLLDNEGDDLTPTFAKKSLSRSDFTELLDL